MNMAIDKKKEFLLSEADSTLSKTDVGFLDGKRVLITGATGLIGSAIVRTILRANSRLGIKTKLLLPVRSVDKAAALFAPFASNDDAEIFQWDIASPLPEVKADYVIHGAAPTSSQFMVSNPVETIDAIYSGTKNFLTYARNSGVLSTVFLSSLEMYGSPLSPNVEEDKNGLLDTMKPRSSYPEAKRLAETLCASYASQYGTNVSVARLAQTFGGGVDYNDNRVFAYFARSVIEGNDIVLRTPGNTCRNYCSVVDAVQAILLLLAKGKSGNAYNIASPETYCSINEFAKAFIKCSGRDLKLIHDLSLDSSQYPAELKILLDTAKINSLGFNPTSNLTSLVEDLLRWFRIISE